LHGSILSATEHDEFSFALTKCRSPIDFYRREDIGWRFASLGAALATRGRGQAVNTLLTSNLPAEIAPLTEQEM